MLIVKVAECPEFVAGDETLLREVLHPAVHGAPIRYSIAQARIRPRGRSLPHRLTGSEVYYFLLGRGRMYIDDEYSEVEAGQIVYVPPGAIQFVENLGDGDLVFLCIVDPAWRAEDEDVPGMN